MFHSGCAIGCLLLQHHCLEVHLPFYRGFQKSAQCWFDVMLGYNFYPHWGDFPLTSHTRIEGNRGGWGVVGVERAFLVSRGQKISEVLNLLRSTINVL